MSIEKSTFIKLCEKYLNINLQNCRFYSITIKEAFFMFWDNFYNLCELKNTTPNAVCKELNLSTATATHWKNGTMPKGDVLFNIANLLDCSVDYLLGRTANPNGYSNKIVNNGKTTINDSGIQANVVNNSQLGKYSSNEMTEQLVMRFENLSFDDKLDVLNYINNKKNT